MTGKTMPLRERDASTIQAAADAFVSSPRYANPNTRRGYTGVLDRLLTGLGASRQLAEVSGRSWPACWNSSGDSGPQRPGTVGDAYDNALAESVIGLFKTELDLGLCRLVQPPAALCSLRGHPTRRTRSCLLLSEHCPHRGRSLRKLSLRKRRCGSR
jgi:hypothetical protein